MSDPELPAGAPAVQCRRQALAFLRRTLELASDEVRPIGPAVGFRSPSLAAVWTLNQLRLDSMLSPTQVVAFSEEHQADLPYRHVVVEDPETARSLAPALLADGWAMEREVVMALSGPIVPVPTHDPRVVELSEDEALSLMRRWDTDEHPDASADTIDQLVEAARREGRVWPERRFGVLDHSRSPLSMTKLRSGDDVAHLEDVYTVPEARGRGFARALVTHAAELAGGRPDRAGAGCVFIVADEDDWPKNLYAEVGFRPVGWTRTFHLEIGDRRPDPSA
jgi:GNAT superfamily N-acetyltransferase